MSQTKTWSLLTATLVVLMLIAGWFLLLSPQRSHAADLRGQASEQQQANEGLKTQVATLKAQQAAEPANTARLAAISQRLPDNEALPALVRALTAAASAAGVELVTIAPATANDVVLPVSAAPVAPAAAAGDESTPEATPAVAGTGLQQVPLTLTVNGDYANIQQFLAGLEDLTRATVVDGISLQPGAPLLAAGATGAVSGTADDVEGLDGGPRHPCLLLGRARSRDRRITSAVDAEGLGNPT